MWGTVEGGAETWATSQGHRGRGGRSVYNPIQTCYGNILRRTVANTPSAPIPMSKRLEGSGVAIATAVKVLLTIIGDGQIASTSSEVNIVYWLPLPDIGPNELAGHKF